MTTVIITPPKNITFDWTAGRHAGWPKGKSRMVALLGANVNLTYVFPFTPTQIEFSDLSNNYTEIERPGNFKLIERRAPNLTRVSFSFLAVDRDSQGKRSIENQLRFLNRISTANAPIAFAGMGGLLGLNHQGTYRLWRITDFGFTVTRKNEKNDVSQAECRITLVEDRNPSLPVETLTQIVYRDTPVRLSDDNPSDDDDSPDVVLNAAQTDQLETYIKNALRTGSTRRSPRAIVQGFLTQQGITLTSQQIDVVVASSTNAGFFRLNPRPAPVSGSNRTRTQ